MANDLTVIEEDDAKKIGELYWQARQNIVASVKCLVECGQRLRAKKGELGHGKWGAVAQG